jgi:hypothetical protein
MEQDETQVVQPEQTDELEAVEPDWKAEALKYKAMAHKYKERASKPEQPTVVETPSYSINDDVVDLRLDGYSKSEVEFIMKNGGRKSLDDQNSITAVALRALRDQKKAEMEASKTADTSQMTEVERKYSPEQLRNMPLAELEKLVPKA